MRRIVAVTLILCLCFGLCACGKSSRAKKADELILAIGEVTLENCYAVEEAQNFYDTLTDEQKAEVENYNLLRRAQETLESLEKIAAVESDINAIGTVTIDSEAFISAAQSAVASLSEAEKKMVSNLDTLGDAQIKYVEILIDVVGPVSVDSGEKIAKAQNYYDMLTSEQQEKVTNYAALEQVREEIERINAALPEATKLIGALRVVQDKLEFIAKYAGNVNGSGSMKFADSFLQEMIDTFDGIDMDLISNGIPELANAAYDIQTNYYNIGSLLIDMGDRNSAENVPLIKRMSLDTITMIGELLNQQLEYANALQGKESG